MYRTFALVLPFLVAACAATSAGPADAQAAPAAATAPGATSKAPGAELTGVVWSWRRVLVGNEPPDPPELFTLEFVPGGKFTTRIDCNNGGGSWMVDEAKIRMTSVRISKMMCPPGWKDREFSKGIEGAETWSLANGELVITTRGEVGKLRFVPLRK